VGHSNVYVLKLNISISAILLPGRWCRIRHHASYVIMFCRN